MTGIIGAKETGLLPPPSGAEKANAKVGNLQGRPTTFFDEDYLKSPEAGFTLAITAIALILLGITAISFSLWLAVPMILGGLAGGAGGVHIIVADDEEVPYDLKPQACEPRAAADPTPKVSRLKKLLEPSSSAKRIAQNKAKFDQLIHRYFEEKESKGDGNCLFHSLAHFFPDRTHVKLRDEICDFMLAHSDYFKGFLTSDTTLEKYVKHMRPSSWSPAWGGLEELVAFVGVQATKGQHVQINIFDSAEELPTEVEIDGKKTLLPNLERGSDAKVNAHLLIIGPGINDKDKPPLAPEPAPESKIIRIDLLRTGESHYSALVLRPEPLPEGAPPPPLPSLEKPPVVTPAITPLPKLESAPAPAPAPIIEYIAPAKPRQDEDPHDAHANAAAFNAANALFAHR